MKQGDVDFLRNYAAGGGTVLVQQPGGGYAPAGPGAFGPAPAGPGAGPQPGGQPGGASPAGGPGGPGQLSPAAAKAQAQHQKVLYQQQKAAQRQQQQQTAQRKQAATRGALLGLEAAGGRMAALGEKVRGINEWAGRQPTPGGIGLMLIILGVTISAIVPVNQGHTRLELAGMTLLNQTYIPESDAANQARDAGQLGDGSSSGSSSGGKSIEVPTLPGLPPIQVPLPTLPTLPKITLPGTGIKVSSPVSVPTTGQLDSLPLGGIGIRS